MIRRPRRAAALCPDRPPVVSDALIQAQALAGSLPKRSRRGRYQLEHIRRDEWRRSCENVARFVTEGGQPMSFCLVLPDIMGVVDHGETLSLSDGTWSDNPDGFEHV